jgi:hypothetical protein
MSRRMAEQMKVLPDTTNTKSFAQMAKRYSPLSKTLLASTLIFQTRV